MSLRQKDADMTQGTIWKQFVAFSIPMAIGLLFQQLYNTVDTVVVGQFVGKEALAAVGSTTSIVNMLVGLCAGLATGASVVISQSYGAHDHQRLHDAVHTTITMALLLCVVATVAGILIVDPMLRMMNTPADVYDEAKHYLTIYFTGISGLLMYNMGSGILRAVGDSRRPLLFLIFSAVINTLLDLLFVVAFRLGVAGVAWATVISQLLSSILVLASLTHDNAAYGIHWHDLGIRKDMLKRILSIGFPSGIQQGLTSFSNVFVQSYINAFGSACMAGWSAHNKLDAFVLIPVQSIALASTTFVGQNWGAKKTERAKQGVRQALLLSLIATFVMMALLMLLARPMLSMFTGEQEVLDFGIRFIYIISPFYLAICFNQIYGGALRGIGNAKVPMLIMLFSFVLFRQCYLFLTDAIFGQNLVLVALGYPMGWIMCSTLLIIFYRRSALFKAHDLLDTNPSTSSATPV